MSLLSQLIPRIHALHYQTTLPGWWRLLCTPIAWVYMAVVQGRACLYEWSLLPTLKLPLLVVSVGNITTGGTGKTPIVKALARQWIAEGKRVVILSRGYGASDPQPYARATTPAYGDEAYELQRALPEAVVIVGKNRVATAQRAITEFQPDIFLLDDGFQYRALHRDVNICLVDALQGVGNGDCLPLGPLREPVSALSRATHVWLTKLPATLESPQHEALLTTWKKRLEPYTSAPLGVSVASLAEPLLLSTWLATSVKFPSPILEEAHSLPQGGCILFSAIAQPASFQTLVQAAYPWVQLVTTVALADHAPVNEAVLIELEQKLNTLGEAAYILMTEKDATKWLPWQGEPRWARLLARCWVAPLRVTLPHLDSLHSTETMEVI
jgi:tetraacyldisaccharide 4'-kinase